MLFLIFRIKTSLFCWSIITKKYSDVKIQLDLRFTKIFYVENIASYGGWAFVMTLERQRWRAISIVVLMLLWCVPAVPLSILSTVPIALQIASVDMISLRKENIIIHNTSIYYIYIYIISPWCKHWNQKSTFELPFQQMQAPTLTMSSQPLT